MQVRIDFNKLLSYEPPKPGIRQLPIQATDDPSDFVYERVAGDIRKFTQKLPTVYEQNDSNFPLEQAEEIARRLIEDIEFLQSDPYRNHPEYAYRAMVATPDLVEEIWTTLPEKQKIALGRWLKQISEDSQYIHFAFINSEKLISRLDRMTLKDYYNGY